MSSDDFSDFDEGINYEEEDEIVEEIEESDLLNYLDTIENPFVVCSKLFKQPNDYEKFSVINKEVVQSLREKGFSHIDNVLPQQCITEIYNHAMERVKNNKLMEANIPTEDDPFRDPTARGDLIEWLKEDDFNSEVSFQPLKEIFNKLGEDLDKVIKLNFQLIERQLGYYSTDNIGYSKHRDALPDDGENENPFYQPRRITAIIYINDTPWSPDNGGALRLYLNNLSHLRFDLDNNNNNNNIIDEKKEERGEEERYMDIDPLPGRMVVFLSGAVDHQVLPVGNKSRLAITSWYH